MTIRELLSTAKIRPHHFTVLRHDMLQPGIRGSAARHRQVNGSDDNHAFIICGVQAAFSLLQQGIFRSFFHRYGACVPYGVGRLQYSDDNMLQAKRSRQGIG